MTTTEEHIAAIRKALEAGPTPGEWGIWEEKVANKADAAAELVYQVENTDGFCGSIYLISAGGKCPAETGCGPTSKVDAAYIAACNPVAISAVLAEIDRLKAENGRMRESALEEEPVISEEIEPIKNEHWKQYANDFNSMTDEQIQRETNSSRDIVDEHEDWLEAVASWERAGKPRNAETKNS